MTPQRPNILLIMSDQHTPEALGAYGNVNAHTPNLDRLAREGVRFDRAYCNNPLCVPSRLSFLTGQTTQQLQCWSLSDTIRSDELTWPALLGAAGYDTVMSGRMHLWWPDKLLGFQRRLCGDGDTKVSGTYRALWGSDPRSAELAEGLREDIVREFREQGTGVGPHPGIARDREATQRAIELIRTRRSDAPFALCVGLLCPHNPFRVPEEYYAPFDGLPVTVEPLDESLPAFIKDFVRHTGWTDEAIAPEAVRRAVRAYHGLVTSVDERVGELVTALEETGQLDQTVVIYTSDHGEMLGRHGFFFKQQLLEGSIRVPLIVRWPAGVVRGAVVNAVVSLLDLFPTFTELAGAPSWPEARGRSLLPLLGGGDVTPFEDRPVFVEYADFGLPQPTACILRRNLKLLAARGYPRVLFDLAADPDEQVNRYQDPEYARAVEQLERDLASHWDADRTYERVARNQQRIELIHQSRRGADGRRDENRSGTQAKGETVS